MCGEKLGVDPPHLILRCFRRMPRPRCPATASSRWRALATVPLEAGDSRLGGGGPMGMALSRGPRMVATGVAFLLIPAVPSVKKENQEHPGPKLDPCSVPCGFLRILHPQRTGMSHCSPLAELMVNKHFCSPRAYTAQAVATARLRVRCSLRSAAGTERAGIDNTGERSLGIGYLIFPPLEQRICSVGRLWSNMVCRFNSPPVASKVA